MTNIPHSPARTGPIVFFFLIAVMAVYLIVNSASVFEVKTGTYGLSAGFVLIGFLIIVPIFLITFNRWQWGICALIYYMPFSGLPSILLYPYIGTGIPTLIKDIAFVIPAYLGFAWWYHKNSLQLTDFPREMKRTLFLMTCLALLVLAHIFNRQLVSYMVGLIGLKVWLFYMPLYVLGYYLITDKSQLIRLSKIFLMLGMIPAIFGIVQAQLIYMGDPGLAYALYGEAASDATQLFARFDTAGGSGLVRIPSLFTFPLQYSSFLFALLAVCYALYMGSEYFRQKRTIYALALGIITVAIITSGARSVFVLLPGFLVLALLLSGKGGQVTKSMTSLFTLIPLALGAIVFFLQSTLETFLDFALSVVTGYLSPSGDASLVNQFEYALNVTWIGMGPGMNTGQARYAVSGTDVGSYINMLYYAGVESLPGKAILEIGVPGLILVVVLFGWIIISSYRQIGKLQDPLLRGFGVSLFAFLVIVIAWLYKGAVLDYDPINVFFWLFAGVLFKLPTLEKGSA